MIEFTLDNMAITLAGGKNFMHASFISHPDTTVLAFSYVKRDEDEFTESAFQDIVEYLQTRIDDCTDNCNVDAVYLDSADGEAEICYLVQYNNCSFEVLSRQSDPN